MTFAELVKQQRKPLGEGMCLLTQEEAAERVGVSVSTWRRWETGRCLPRPAELRRFIAVFGLRGEVALACRVKRSE